MNLKESVWVKKEHLGNSRRNSCVILGKSHHRVLFCNMKLMHNIGKSALSQETRRGVRASSDEPRMAQADARWEKTRGNKPFSTTTRSGSNRSRQRLRKPGTVRVRVGGSVGLDFMIRQGDALVLSQRPHPKPLQHRILNP